MVDHLFRHEAGKMVAVLTRLFGFPNIEQAEDIVQDTIIKALESWKFGKMPDNPQAWLYKVAKNSAIDLIRRQKLKYKIDNDLTQQLQSEYTLSPVVNELFLEHEIKDSQLRMMYACCHPAIAPEAQVTLILKTLCGLSAKEISNAFLTNEETINKRLYRTKEKLRNEGLSLDCNGAEELNSRREAVLQALYLLFNEGYNSSHPEQLIREDLCEEAMRLIILLTEHPKTNKPEAYALLALMCYQVSRFKARMDDKGFIVLLKDQDRSQWSRFLIEKANRYLELAATGDKVHQYHIEASIASVHANAPTYDYTNWRVILNLYDHLLQVNNSPMVALNRCLALVEVTGPLQAIEELLELKGTGNSCYYKTALGELYYKAGNYSEAVNHYLEALPLTTSNAERMLIERKLALCSE